jgi:hypothetical protein
MYGACDRDDDTMDVPGAVICDGYHQVVPYKIQYFEILRSPPKKKILWLKKIAI